MGKVQITIEIDDSSLAGYTDRHLAMCWHVAQANPAPHGDRAAGELVERVGREIVRRWLGGVEPELWHHQGRDHYWSWLARFASYTPGAGFRSAPAGSDEATRVFHEGHWSVRPEAAAALLPGAESIVKAAIAWAAAKQPGAGVMAGIRAEKDLAAAVERRLQADTADHGPTDDRGASGGEPGCGSA